MIVVLGRPALAPAGPGAPSRPAGLVARIALAVAAEGRAVELVGTIGEDDRGDELTVALGHAGVGHAALLRIAGASTPAPDDPPQAWPRLSAADVDLGLRYVPECRVLVLAEPLQPGVVGVAVEAAAYHAAALVAVLAPDSEPDPALTDGATTLAAPRNAAAPFAALVGRYAARLDAGEAAGVAFAAAVREVGWAPTGAAPSEAGA